MSKLHMIWTSDTDFEDWKDGLKENYPNLSDDELRVMMDEANAEYLEDEKMNLDIQLPRPIVVVATLGLWDGRRTAVGTNGGWRNLNHCLEIQCESTLDAEFFVDDNGDFCSVERHHDGANCFTFRMWREGITDVQKELFTYRALRGILSKKDYDIFTERLGDYAADVYGWRDLPDHPFLPKRRRRAA